MDCVFCKIIAGEIPADKIYEDDLVMSFLDIRPISRGHVLVIPKKHSEDITATDDESLTDLILKTKTIANAVIKAVNAEGFTISTNKGQAAGQTVFHIHFHIIPRFSNDGLKPWPHHESEPKSRHEIAEAIRKNLPRHHNEFYR